MEVSSQLHAPAALPPGKNPRYLNADTKILPSVAPLTFSVALTTFHFDTVLLNNHGDAFLEARGYEYLLQKSH
jgi:hypothetical protein